MKRKASSESAHGSRSGDMEIDFPDTNVRANADTQNLADSPSNEANQESSQRTSLEIIENEDGMVIGYDPVRHNYHVDFGVKASDTFPPQDKSRYYLVELAAIFKYGQARDPLVDTNEVWYWSNKAARIAAVRSRRNMELSLGLDRNPERTAKQLHHRWLYLQECHENGILVLDDEGALIGFNKGRKNGTQMIRVPSRRDLGLPWTAAEEAVWERFLGDPGKIPQQFLMVPIDREDSRRKIDWIALKSAFPARTEAMLKAHHAKRLREALAEAVDAAEVADMAEVVDTAEVSEANHWSLWTRKWQRWTADELIRILEGVEAGIKWKQLAEDPVFKANGRDGNAVFKAYERHFGSLDAKQQKERLLVMKLRRESEEVEEPEVLEESTDSASASLSTGNRTLPHLKPTYPWGQERRLEESEEEDEESVEEASSEESEEEAKEAEETEESASDTSSSYNLTPPHLRPVYSWEQARRLEEFEEEAQEAEEAPNEAKEDEDSASVSSSTSTLTPPPLTPTSQ